MEAFLHVLDACFIHFASIVLPFESDDSDGIVGRDSIVGNMVQETADEPHLLFWTDRNGQYERGESRESALDSSCTLQPW